MDELSPLTPAEERLLKAVREDEECNLADGSYLVQSDETSDWGKDRTVRAELLQQLMHNRHLTEYVEAIDLRAARIVGDLRSSGLDEVVPIALIDCRMDGILCNGAYFGGDVNFHGTTFTGEVKFDDAIFAGEARFDAVTFEDAAGFLSSTFRKDAKFGRATFSDHVMFGGADFHGATDFEGAKFATVAWFIQTTFTDTSTFQGVRFDHFASFEDAIFGRLADFRGATFGGAVFTRAIFTEDARFDRARFSGAVQFLDATFAHDQVYFDEVTFTDTAQFTGAIAREWNLRSTKFLASDPGPWTGIKVDLSNAVLHESSNIFLTAREVIARRLQSRESVHLEVHTESLDLSDAEFLRHSILSVPPPSTRRIPHRPPDSKGQISFRRRSTATDPDRASDARTEARNEAKVLAGQLANEVGLSKLPARCGVTSLSRANVGELVIAGTAMDSCSFSGAHGLDTLTISEDCTFQRTKWSLQRPTQFTRRRVIAEEVLWRQQHGHFWGAQGTPRTLLQHTSSRASIATSAKDSKTRRTSQALRISITARWRCAALHAEDREPGRPATSEVILPH